MLGVCLHIPMESHPQTVNYQTSQSLDVYLDFPGQLHYFTNLRVCSLVVLDSPFPFSCPLILWNGSIWSRFTQCVGWDSKAQPEGAQQENQQLPRFTCTPRGRILGSTCRGCSHKEFKWVVQSSHAMHCTSTLTSLTRMVNTLRNEFEGQM